MGSYLHELMISSHSYYVTYGEIRYLFGESDAYPGMEGYFIDFYSKEPHNATWDSGSTWNREHVWCQSLSNGLWDDTGNSTRGGGADLLHVRPLNSSDNSSRNNNPYGEIESGGVSKNYGTLIDNVVVEPFDNVKGNIARELFYIYMHYSDAFGDATNNHYVGTLDITDIVYAGDEASCWALLLEWNKLDPVEDCEKVLNDYCYPLQGNRNPFIDCPDFADAIWGVN